MPHNPAALAWALVVGCEGRATDEIVKEIRAMSETLIQPDLAARLFESNDAAWRIEETLFEKWPWVDSIGWDEYDQSLEIYCGEDAPPDWSISREDAQTVFSMGFAGCYVNFADGTEQGFNRDGHHGVRRKVEHPRWSVEQSRVQLEVKRLRAQVAQQAAQIAEMRRVIVAAHFPPLGECACCGGPDAQHRTLDAIRGRYRAGETAEDLAADYGVSLGVILAVVEDAG